MNNTKPRIWLLGSEFYVAEEILNIADIEEGDYEPYATESADLMSEYQGVVWKTPSPVKPNGERHKQLNTFLERDEGILVFFLNLYVGDNSVSTLSVVSNLWVNKIGQIQETILFNRKGLKYDITKEGQISPFREYLEIPPTQWFIALKQTDKIIPLALNADNQAIAFSLKEYPHTSFFLPPPKDSNHQDLLLKELIEAISSIRDFNEDVPNWVSNYKILKMNKLKSIIDESENKIQKISIKVKKVKTKFSHLEQIRNILLIGDGKALEKVVNQVLKEIGFNPIEGPVGKHDIIFSYEDKKFLAETKGSTSSTSEKNIKQLQAKKTEYEAQEKEKVKGTLIINPWRQYLPDERENKDRTIYPDALMSLVNIWEISMLTTMQLLEIYKLHLEKKLDKKKLAETWFNTVGPVKGYDLKK